VDLIADSVLVAESPSAGSTSWSSVIGIDLRPALVVEVRRHMADVPWVQVLEGDASALPLENNRVDRARADRALSPFFAAIQMFIAVARKPR
jgi:ubiquinone/menaquinone biosynthesis C-methylase UbiE